MYSISELAGNKVCKDNNLRIDLATYSDPLRLRQKGWGDGSLSVSLSASTNENWIIAKATFTIVQDIYNLSLLQELKEYFNDKGAIRELKSKCSIYTRI